MFQTKRLKIFFDLRGPYSRIRAALLLRFLINHIFHHSVFNEIYEMLNRYFAFAYLFVIGTFLSRLNYSF